MGRTLFGCDLLSPLGHVEAHHRGCYANRFLVLWASTPLGVGHNNIYITRGTSSGTDTIVQSLQYVQVYMSNIEEAGQRVVRGGAPVSWLLYEQLPMGTP